MSVYQTVTLTRDVPAIQIPGGTEITLPAESVVYITQTLGGSYTVATDMGLARISKENADALGLSEGIETKPLDTTLTEGSLEERTWAALRTVYDPEIPVDIVNLGLIYECLFNETEEPGLFDVIIKMTLTAPGCGMGPVIMSDVEARVSALPDVRCAVVELVWDPPWNQDMVSEDGKMILGFA